jgi:purine-nucleoside phosphorylase
MPGIAKSELETHHLSPVSRQSTAGYRQARQAADFLRKGWPWQPRVGIVLGSGLGNVLPRLRDALTISYKRIPFFPQPRVPGHVGVLHLGFWREVPVAVLAGRVHLYEGYTSAEVVFPVRVLILAGVKVLLLTCTAGGISPRAVPGGFMLFSDHLNLQCASPLAGVQACRWGPCFVDMSEAYDRDLRRRARKAAAGLPLKCFAGVYAALPGPTYETPAEIRALKRLGADAVGMSTVPEVVAARQLGVRVLAIAAITNRAAGLSCRPLRHEEVLEAGKRAARSLAPWLDRLLPKLQATAP